MRRNTGSTRTYRSNDWQEVQDTQLALAGSLAVEGQHLAEESRLLLRQLVGGLPHAIIMSGVEVIPDDTRSSPLANVPQCCARALG
jgi:hypothetical protein